LRYYIITILIVLLNSCTNTSFNQLSSDININVEANLNATVKVGEKINGTGSESSFLWLFRVPGIKYRSSGANTSMTSSYPAGNSILSMFSIVENAKGEAIHDAITTSKADIIINPKFTITETDYFIFKTVKCEVTGLKGTINKVQ
jgi:hypothetical protein